MVVQLMTNTYIWTEYISMPVILLFSPQKVFDEHKASLTPCSNLVSLRGYSATTWEALD